MDHSSVLESRDQKGLHFCSFDLYFHRMMITVVPFLPLNHQKRRRIVQVLNLLYKTKWKKLNKVLIERLTRW